MSIYTQLEADNKADRDTLCLVQTMAYQLRGQTMTDYGRALIDDIVKKCELRLKGDLRLSANAIIADIHDVRESK